MIESTLRESYPELFSMIDRDECGLGYSPKVREFHLAVRPNSDVVQRLSFCPFSGKPLPSSLRHPFFDALELIGLVDGLSDVEKTPEEFQSEAWWLARGLEMKTVLFVCSRNRLRSPTAEQVFADWPGVETASAGLAPDAEEVVTGELVAWADIAGLALDRDEAAEADQLDVPAVRQSFGIFVMEKRHRSTLRRRFRASLGRARVICLDVPDNYGFMDPALVAILKARVPRFLRG